MRGIGMSRLADILERGARELLVRETLGEEDLKRLRSTPASMPTVLA